MARVLIGLATTVMAFGVLFAQAPTTNHVPDLVIWSLAVILLLPAIWKTWKRAPTNVGWLIVSGIELLFCVYVLVDIVQHLHSL